MGVAGFPATAAPLFAGLSELRRGRSPWQGTIGGPIVLIRPGSASTPIWASLPGDGRRRVGRVQVAGASAQVQPHRLHRPARISGPQRVDELVMIDLVFLPALR